MSWDISFIREEDFAQHVANTIEHYGTKLLPYNVEKFNSNIIDPIKMVFDKAVYGQTWEELIAAEIFRQRDKSNTNDIGYFHQRLFQYIDGCHVPANGQEGGWDVIVDMPEGYSADGINVVHKIYVEMKNKHNTMNSSAAGKTYIKMQNQLLHDDDCVCMLVEVIAKQHQNITWKTSVDGRSVSHARIRRVSIDEFYSICTGERDAFYRICLALPNYVQHVLDGGEQRVKRPKDTVVEELMEASKKYGMGSGDLGMMMAMYMLGFGTYNGFADL